MNTLKKIAIALGLAYVANRLTNTYSYYMEIAKLERHIENDTTLSKVNDELKKLRSRYWHESYVIDAIDALEGSDDYKNKVLVSLDCVRNERREAELLMPQLKKEIDKLDSIISEDDNVKRMRENRDTYNFRIINPFYKRF